MEKVSIKNRKGQKIVVLVEEQPKPNGLAFVMHGFSGSKEQEHIAVIAESFEKAGSTVVRFDTTNSCGESYGNYEDATVTNYYEDLEDVINWAGEREWYQEPFWLAGHSLGGICIALYAENHPTKVKALAPISTVVSGKLSLESSKNKSIWREWKRTGWKEWESGARPGFIKRLPWQHMEDRLKYDLLKGVGMLTMPVLLIVGENDESTPPEHQKILYEKLPGKKEIHIIKGAQHSFRAQDDSERPENLEQIKHIFSKWIKENIN